MILPLDFGFSSPHVRGLGVLLFLSRALWDYISCYDGPTVFLFFGLPSRTSEPVPALSLDCPYHPATGLFLLFLPCSSIFYPTLPETIFASFVPSDGEHLLSRCIFLENVGVVNRGIPFFLPSPDLSVGDLKISFLRICIRAVPSFLLAFMYFPLRRRFPIDILFADLEPDFFSFPLWPFGTGAPSALVLVAYPFPPTSFLFRPY